MREALNQGLIDFLKASPTPFHATAALAQRLEAAGYQRLDERDTWTTEANGRYYVTRNDSSIIAFKLGRHSPLQGGIRLVGAHTDSPCLRVKPQPELQRQGFWQLGVEVYGGALLAPWFDRDLSLAGRVTFRRDGKVESQLIDFKLPIAIIPNLAIHLNREANQGWAINAQTELPPILAQFAGDERVDFRAVLTEQLAREHGLNADVVLDYELSFYDTQSAAVIGLNGDFIAGARLDNLLSCYAGLQALLTSDTDETCVLVCNDHEEVGSCSACGADGPMLEQTLRRLLPEGDEFVRTIQKSLLVSADNAHGVHPNYAEKHDANHGPKLNAGPVIKVNSNQRYATNSETAGFFRHLCMAEEVPVQSFVVRSDMGCGSTIGPITASHLGVRTVDIGLPTFAMHSIRELCGSHDLAHLVKVLGAFLRESRLALISGLNAVENVGAGLLAKAECQSLSMLTDPPHSRASPLPHLVLCTPDLHHLHFPQSGLNLSVFPLRQGRRTMISMSSFHAMLIPILIGMILLAVGFNFRDKPVGVFGMWIGMLLILGTVVYKILAKLAE